MQNAATANKVGHLHTIFEVNLSVCHEVHIYV